MPHGRGPGLPSMLALSLALVSGIARAQGHPTASSAPPPQEHPVAPEVAHDATVHFQRGLSLADDGNYVAAMIEFQYAYRLTQNPLVLYNIAVAYAAMGQYVDALDSMRRYETLAEPTLTAARRNEVEASIARYEDRIATITVPLPNRDLGVSIDGVEYPAQQARAAIRVAVGRHVVALRAPGFQPRELHLDVVSGANIVLDRPLDAVPSVIILDSNVAEAAVLVDGHVLAHTPLNGPLVVPMGFHDVRVERDGYRPFETHVRAFGPGATVHAQLDWLDPIPPEVTGRIQIRTRPVEARLSLDGREISIRAVVAAPAGHHTLVAESRNYEPMSVPVRLGAERVRDLELWLTPSPQYISTIRDRRASAIRVAVIGASMLVANVAATILIFAAVNPNATTANTAISVPGWVFLTTVPSAVTGLAMALSGTIQFFRQPIPERLIRPRNVPPVRGTAVSPD